MSLLPVLTELLLLHSHIFILTFRTFRKVQLKTTSFTYWLCCNITTSRSNLDQRDPVLSPLNPVLNENASHGHGHIPVVVAAATSNSVIHLLFDSLLISLLTELEAGLMVMLWKVSGGSSLNYLMVVGGYRWETTPNIK